MNSKLIELMLQCNGSENGDYKDHIAAKSEQLSELLIGESKKLIKEANKRGLLNGYDCPRATSEAWSDCFNHQ